MTKSFIPHRPNEVWDNALYVKKWEVEMMACLYQIRAIHPYALIISHLFIWHEFFFEKSDRCCKSTTLKIKWKKKERNGQRKLRVNNLNSKGKFRNQYCLDPCERSEICALAKNPFEKWEFTCCRIFWISRTVHCARYDFWPFFQNVNPAPPEYGLIVEFLLIKIVYKKKKINLSIVPVYRSSGYCFKLWISTNLS